MRIISNTTSPFARIALGEKGIDLSATEMLNPWADPQRRRRSTPPPACRRRKRIAAGHSPRAY